MRQSLYSLPVSFSVKNEVSNNDTRFLNCTIDVLHTSANLNGSVFSKEVVEENIDTIKNTPILGYIREVPDGEYDFKGHEYIITRDENGIRRKNIGSAWGVVPESCHPRWYSKILDTGEEVEVLQVDALLWSKLEDSREIMLRDIQKAQSMELQPESIDGYEDPETGLFHFTKFSFDGCTILGEDFYPAMQDANITINFTVSDFVKNIQSELINKYSEFTKLVNETTSARLADTNSFTSQVNEKNNQGGIVAMTNIDFAAKFDNISAMVRQHEMFTNRFNEEHSRFEVVDIRENEVIVVDKMNGYNCFGLSFTEDENGEKIEIDFENAKAKKICFEDRTDEDVVFEDAFNFGKYVEEVESMAFSKVEEANTKASESETAKNEIEEKFNQVNAEYEEMKPKYEEFVQAEQARIEAELDAQKDAEFAKYEAIFADDVNFTALKEKKSEMTVKEIESECAIMYARKSLATTFSKSDSGVMTAGLIDNNDVADGFVQTKYGVVRKSR